MITFEGNQAKKCIYSDNYKYVHHQSGQVHII